MEELSVPLNLAIAGELLLLTKAEKTNLKM